MRTSLHIVAALGAFMLSACVAQRATEEDCATILDRIVELEIEELGYVDPVLSERYRASLTARYATRISECIGRPIPPGALECIQQMDTAEAVSHDCLR